MRPQPLISVPDVEATSRWFRKLLGCASAHGGPVYERLVATDGTLMASPIKGGASTFEVGTPQALFQTRRPMTRGPLFFGNYAPDADGQRFLVNTIAADAPLNAISVALNWTAVLQK